jgi:hypothetical protein
MGVLVLKEKLEKAASKKDRKLAATTNSCL